MLTYCTNIHPGESWADTFASLQTNVPGVRQGLGAPEGFPLCLWLSQQAAAELDDVSCRKFLDWCREQSVSITSLNGFPYGGFHDLVVKQQAYVPDWRSEDRLAYTTRLADLLSGWIEPGKQGVVTTVPVGWHAASEDWRAARRNLERALDHFDRLSQRSGYNLVLALEPEPGCVLETATDAAAFVEGLHLSPGRRRHLGICFDCCHHAVLFEPAAKALQTLAEAGLPVSIVHLSSALRVPGAGLARLRPFAEPRYLHQTAGRTASGNLVRFDDLDNALAFGNDGCNVEEWRVHFHVPLFAERIGECLTTQPDLLEAISLLPADVPLVVETYSFGVLPPELRAGSVVDAVVRELAWARNRIACRSGEVCV